MKYKVIKKKTLLVGREKISGGRSIPSAIVKKIGEQGIKTLLADGSIKEVKEEKEKSISKIEAKPLIETVEEKDELQDHTRDELFEMAGELGLDLPARSSKGELIYAIEKEME